MLRDTLLAMVGVRLSLVTRATLEVSPASGHVAICGMRLDSIHNRQRDMVALSSNTVLGDAY